MDHTWDMQKIDMGIALCHFMSVKPGGLSIVNPGIAVSDDIIAWLKEQKA
ncbi:MAG: hypothetical protein IJ733_20020 [Lachnospiraceae bacterium]|nr:hypothetical protein [Lachnospiraceae bacterium]